MTSTDLGSVARDLGFTDPERVRDGDGAGQLLDMYDLAYRK